MNSWRPPRIDLLVAFRWLVVVSQAATIAITWPLWTVRDDPPLLPAVAGPQFSPAIWLLLTLALGLVWPRLGVLLHLVLLLVAMLLDQTRMQPEVISLALLLVGTLPAAGARLIGRTHLVALWFFAGLHKLASPGYFTGVIPWLFGTDAEKPSTALVIVGALLAAAEMSLGLLALVPRTRRLCAVAACWFHLLVFAWLAARLHWNPAVWPWNIALAAAGFALVWPWQTSLAQDLQVVGWPARVAAIVLLASPVGYYFGLVDPYLAHCLYARNVPKAERLTSSGPQPLDIWDALRVPLPPAHRVLEQYFQATALPGERLVIDDPRWWAHWRGWGRREIRAQANDAAD
ncbi:MAG: hypothetical protein AB7U73_18045 [Pirellulales bacterium]